MRKYKTVKTWRKENPGVRALILMAASGRSFILHASEPDQEGKFALIGVIE